MAAEAAPDRYTATMSKKLRRGKIFIDWLRNDRGSTAVAPFSVRARPGGPVAVPVGWDELKQIRRANAFSMKRAIERGWENLELPSPASLNEVLLGKFSGLAT